MSQVIDSIREFNRPLLPDMVKLKYEGMAENSFRFYRGTCHLFYEDLAKAEGFPKTPLTWTCGDLHIENFGSYCADNDLVYFDLNDFDESILAPAGWEVVRVVTSILVAFDILKISPKKAINLARLFLRSYAAALVCGKAISIDPRTAKGIVQDFLISAEHNSENTVVEKRTQKKKKKLVLSLSDERHFKLDKQLRKALKAHVQEWVKTSSDGPYNYKVKDVIFRLAGTGSIGLKRYLFLLKSTRNKKKYLLLDMKQSRSSSLLPHVQAVQPEWPSEAGRIIFVQKRMQNMSASLLSATEFEKESYVIQELQPTKDSINFKLIQDRYRDIMQVTDDMAVLTASAQLRSGGMNGSAIIDELKAFGANEQWQEQLLAYAMLYVKKVKQDYRIFCRALKSNQL